MIRGEIYLANLNPASGSEQGGTRPVLIVSRDALNLHSPIVIVAPITGREHKRTALPYALRARSRRGRTDKALGGSLRASAGDIQGQVVEESGADRCQQDAVDRDRASDCDGFVDS